jgi:hypothetical protein
MAKKKLKVGAGDSKYVTLNIYTKRRAFTLFLCVLLTLLFSSWIWGNLAQNRGSHWFWIGLPMVFIGLLANFLLPAEEWSYGPWQDSTQKYERNIYD